MYRQLLKVIAKNAYKVKGQRMGIVCKCVIQAQGKYKVGDYRLVEEI